MKISGCLALVGGIFFAINSLGLASETPSNFAQVLNHTGPTPPPFDTDPTDFDIFLNLLYAADLTPLLNHTLTNGLTLFVPNDEAIGLTLYHVLGQYPTSEWATFEILQMYLQSHTQNATAYLRYLLAYHIVEATISIDMLRRLTAFSAMNGEIIRVNTSIVTPLAALIDNEPAIPDPRVIPGSVDFSSSAGMVHVIDGVMFPHALISDPNLNTSVPDLFPSFVEILPTSEPEVASPGVQVTMEMSPEISDFPEEIPSREPLISWSYGYKSQDPSETPTPSASQLIVSVPTYPSMPSYSPLVTSTAASSLHTYKSHHPMHSGYSSTSTSPKAFDSISPSPPSPSPTYFKEDGSISPSLSPPDTDEYSGWSTSAIPSSHESMVPWSASFSPTMESSNYPWPSSLVYSPEETEESEPTPDQASPEFTAFLSPSLEIESNEAGTSREPQVDMSPSQVISAIASPSLEESPFVAKMTNSPQYDREVQRSQKSRFFRKTRLATEHACFPANAMVHLENGTMIEMEKLSAGTHIHVSQTTLSPVYMFTHRRKNIRYAFAELRTVDGHVLTVSMGHYIYANNLLVAAGDVKIGDTLRTLDGDSPISDIRVVMKKGLFSPHTVHGDLVINRVVVSSYTTTLPPQVFHHLLAPVRWAVQRGWAVEPFGSVLYDGIPSVRDFILRSHKQKARIEEASS